MSIRERVAITEARRARAQVDDSYSHGWAHRPPQRQGLGEVGEFLGYIAFAATALLGIGYFLPRFLESIH